MKPYSLLLFFLFVLVPFKCFAASANFVWTPNSNVAGYKIYYGDIDGEYSNVIDIGKGVEINGWVFGSIQTLTPGISYNFVATAYDSDGLESSFSTPVKWTVREDVYPVTPDIKIVILRRNPDGKYDIMDSDGVLLVSGVIIP